MRRRVRAERARANDLEAEQRTVHTKLTVPVWSRDGSELFYRNGDQMLVVGVETEPEFAVTRPTPLFEGSYDTDVFGSPNANYDVALDGQFLMIWRSETDSIALVQNWFDELQRLVPSP